MVKSLATVMPGLIHYPILPTEKQYVKGFLNKNKEEITKQKLSCYLNVIPKNEKILRERRKSGKVITFLLGTIIILILVFNVV